MQLFAGTSGFAYKTWRGSFYPLELRDDEMLPWYARQLTAVEINSTFYRFPTPAGLAAWASRVPENFRFAIKVPRRITHIKRLKGVDDELHYLVETVMTLGNRLGPLLFQLPPNFPADLSLLEDLAPGLPPPVQAAFEFRHRSWFCEPVYRILAREAYALCFNDSSDAELHATADWGYVRLRKEQYSETDLENAATLVSDQPWGTAYVFFKHEAPDSPVLARHWAQLAARR
jgi:uncharacterized protein YecE (DUF72 family)